MSWLSFPSDCARDGVQLADAAPPRAQSARVRMLCYTSELQEVADGHDRIAIVEFDTLRGIPAAPLAEEGASIIDEQADDRLADEAAADLAQRVTIRTHLGLLEHVVPKWRPLQEAALF